MIRRKYVTVFACLAVAAVMLRSVDRLSESQTHDTERRATLAPTVGLRTLGSAPQDLGTDADDSTIAGSAEWVIRSASRRVQLRIGLRIRAVNGSVQKAVATVVNPVEWPEQQLMLVDSEVPTGVQVQTRRVGGTAEQLLMRLGSLPRGTEVLCTRTYELTRWTQRLNPAMTNRLAAVPRDKARGFLEPSDGIESAHAEIRAFAKEAVGDLTEPFDRAVAIFRETRQRVRYEFGPFGGALAGLRTGKGDCEERACLFIAACRASGIPARLVWVPAHCWGEVAFMADGNLIWIPADPTREFELGVIKHFDPILQKGDRFVLPDAPGKPVRYIAPRCSGSGTPPVLESIEEVEMLDDGPTSR